MWHMAPLSPCATRPLLAVVTDVRLQKSCAIGGLRPPEKFQKTFVTPLEKKLTICLGDFQHTCQTHRPDHQSDSRRSTPSLTAMHALVAECGPSLFVECHGELLLHSCLLLHSLTQADAVACAAVLFSPSLALKHSCLVVCSQF